MTRFDPKAILIAMLLSLALDVIGAVVLYTVFSSGMPENMTAEEMKASVLTMQQSSLFLMTSLLYGTGTTVFGGYVAARLARAFPYFNALAVGVLGIVLGLLLASDTPWWADALAYLISIPAALSGARIWQQQRAQQGNQ